MSDNNNTPTPKEWKKKLEYIVKYRLTTDFVTDLQILTELFSTLLSQQKQEIVESVMQILVTEMMKNTEISIVDSFIKERDPTGNVYPFWDSKDTEKLLLAHKLQMIDDLRSSVANLLENKTIK